MAFREGRVLRLSPIDGGPDASDVDAPLLLELQGDAPAGWIELRLELLGAADAHAPLRVLAGSRAHVVPAAKGGRAEVILQVAAGDRLRLQLPPRSRIEVRSIVVRALGPTEAAVRRAVPVVWKRLREPRTIPSAAMKVLRALRNGDLLGGLLRRGGEAAPQAFYPEWHRRYAALDDADRAAIRAAIARLPSRPRFRLSMAADGPPDAALRRSIAAVRAQLYPDWQLIVTPDPPHEADVRRALEAAAGGDGRIRVALREQQEPLAPAPADFVVLLDVLDELEEHALYLLAAESADADVIYADHDEPGDAGHAVGSFKPEWNPDFLLSRSYAGDVVAVRVPLFDRIAEPGATLRSDDLLFRVAAQTERIRRVPFVLHHRSASAASRAEAAGIEVRQRHLGAGPRVLAGPLPATYRVRWPLPSPAPLVSVIIPTRDARAVLEPCVESLLTKTAYRDFELIVVDNQSRDPPTLEVLDSLRRRGLARVVPFDAPFNFSAINNFAVREHARGALVALLNNDLEIVEPGWLEEMVSQALRPEIGAVGARLLYPDGALQHGGIILGIGGAAGHAQRFLPAGAPGYMGRAQLVHDVSAVTAACLVIRRETFLRAGGMDERFAVALNDVDFCLRVRALGLRNLWTPFATLLHRESQTRGPEDTREKKARFAADRRLLQERWGEALRRDPAYNPNLTLDSEDFSLAWPPRVRKPWL